MCPLENPLFLIDLVPRVSPQERSSGPAEETPLVFQARLPDSTTGGSCRASGQGRDTARLKGATSAHSSRLSWARVNLKSSPTGVWWFRLSAGRCAFSPPGPSNRLLLWRCESSADWLSTQLSESSLRGRRTVSLRVEAHDSSRASNGGCTWCFSRHLFERTRKRERETWGAVCGAANPPHHWRFSENVSG